ncbi:MAG: hypothetical protein B7Z62_00340 [Deltaproteobacteria bacterium 37-65-8]|nr:MAG: hypothetical protein B7Z62_00340 [Deltaproteobacteria bacterium 37-65-8]
MAGLGGGETAIVAGVGGFVGMAGALGYGFKLMVDILGKQLAVQNNVISGLEAGIIEKLSSHIAACEGCRARIDAAAASAAATAELAARAIEDRDRRMGHGG